MALYARLKAAIVAGVETWAAGAPTLEVRRRARLALGDAGPGPVYNTVEVDGRLQLVGSMFGYPADPSRPQDGPDPSFADFTGIPLLVRGLSRHLHLVEVSADAAPTVTDDSDAGFDAGSRWIRVDQRRTWTCHDATPGAAVWVEDSDVLDSRTDDPPSPVTGQIWLRTDL